MWIQNHTKGWGGCKWKQKFTKKWLLGWSNFGAFLICLLGHFACFLSSADFFKINFFEKFFQEYNQCQTVWIQIRPNTSRQWVKYTSISSGLCNLFSSSSIALSLSFMSLCSAFWKRARSPWFSHSTSDLAAVLVNSLFYMWNNKFTTYHRHNYRK